MKIAIIVRRLDVKGGTQRQALSLGQELLRRGHEVTFYAFLYDAERCFPEFSRGLKIVSLAAEEPPSFIGKFSGMLEENHLAERLAGLIDKNTDILNPHDSPCHRVAYYFKKYIKNKPSVWTMNDLPAMRWLSARSHAFDARPHVPAAQLIKMWIHDLYEKKFIAAQNAVTVLDEFNRKLLKSYFGAEAVIVRSGVDAALFPYKARRPPLGKRVSLLASGVFFTHRRFEDAIEAVNILVGRGYDPKLSIIGNDKASPAYYKKLVELVRARNLSSRVLFLGEVPDSALIDAYHSYDIFVFPNHPQTWGLAVLEAMATGLPVVVSKGAGVHEVIDDRKTGLLVEPGSPEDLAGRIQELIDNPRLYETLSKDGAAYVRANFSWRQYADGMLKVFESAVAKT